MASVYKNLTHCSIIISILILCQKVFILINRRKFLLYGIGAIGSLFLAPKDTLTKIARAATPIRQVVAPYIKETYLDFAHPLEKRTQTNMLIVHHVGGATDADTSAAQIHQWHLANGWAGIGYHYVIRKDGSIERGRPRDMIGAHCYGYNKTSVGINLVGNFEGDYPTNQQVFSCSYLLAYLCQLYNLDINSRIIYGHRDLNSTLCPGQHLYDLLPGIVQKAYARL